MTLEQCATGNAKKAISGHIIFKIQFGPHILALTLSEILEISIVVLLCEKTSMKNFYFSFKTNLLLRGGFLSKSRSQINSGYKTSSTLGSGDH